LAVETTDWDALRMMRLSGKRPQLPVIVTSKVQLPRRLEGVGCLVILHKAGDVMPIKLLDGLDVILFFDRCELAGHVWKLAKAKGVTFASVKTWCKCAQLLSILPMDCDGHATAMAWLEPKNAA
jgi:hypothetical protein